MGCIVVSEKKRLKYNETYLQIRSYNSNKYYKRKIKLLFNINNISYITYLSKNYEFKKIDYIHIYLISIIIIYMDII